MDLCVSLRIWKEASGMETTYSISAAGVEDFVLFPPCPEPPDPAPNEAMSTDCKSVTRPGRPETGDGPTRTAAEEEPLHALSANAPEAPGTRVRPRPLPGRQSA